MRPLTSIFAISAGLIVLACTAATPGDDPSDPNRPGDDPTFPDANDDELETAVGCAGVFNPDQLLDYQLTMDPADWNALRADQTNSVYFEAQLTCSDGASITVGARRKRSGGAVKVGLKVDINQFVPGQKYYGLKKLSLENGVSEGNTEDRAEVEAYLSEYLAWRLMAGSGAVSGRAVFARVHVNGELIGVYVNVEQVDKRFLSHRLGDDSGWLYKKSGGDRDGLKTHETDGLVDPHEDYFCFWIQGGNACPTPPAAELLQTLPDQLDIEQMLRFGAANALMANTDSPLFKDNNYYWYDWVGGRVYLPWDLDTVMKNDYDVFTGGGIGGGTSRYVDVLFAGWEADYLAILRDLLDQRLTLEVIEGELDRAVSVAGDGFAGDPYVSGSASEAAASLKAYWAGRHSDVRAQVDARRAHDPR